MKKKTARIIVILSLILIFVFIVVYTAINYDPVVSLPETSTDVIYSAEENIYNKEFLPCDFTVYYLVSNITGVDAKILQGYASTESHWNQYAVGDNGISHGLMQINSRYRNEWIKLCGYEYDPYDLFDSVYLCALIYNHNSLYINDPDKLIASYRQGIQGVIDNGITNIDYVNKVKRYVDIMQ